MNETPMPTVELEHGCPICRYSLEGLETLVCPECGVELDLDLISIVHNHDSIALTKTWATIGVVAWLIVGVMIWFFGAVLISLRQTYGGIQPTVYDIAGMWLRSLIIIAPIALLIGWACSNRRRLYHQLLKEPARKPKPLTRVVFVASIAIVIDLCVLFLIGSAI
jgi:hypothetical protein